MREGMLVDATIISAPSSTKNQEGEPWHFGRKAHIGADADSGLVHSVHVTAANESDVANTHALLYGQECRVHADSGHTGVAKRDEIVSAQAEGRIRRDINWLIATKRGTRVAMANGTHKRLAVLVERKKSQIGARMEHPFHIVKNPFGHKKLSYRELAKNGARMYSLFALANLVIAKRPPLRLAEVSASEHRGALVRRGKRANTGFEDTSAARADDSLASKHE